MTTKEEKPRDKNTRIINGIYDLHMSDEPQQIVYYHSIMCQTCLPFKKPENDKRIWKSKNGESRILLKAGELYDKDNDTFFEVPLPYGAKPRLIMYYLNKQSIYQKSNILEVEPTLGQLVKKLGFESNGRDYKTIQNQFGRLSASEMIIGRGEENGSSTTKFGRVVNAANLWYSKSQQQRTLWPNTVELSHEYFESLQKHAVPLDEGAITLIKDSSLSLDIYNMLAERLHRIPFGEKQFASWAFIYGLYGVNYNRIDNFRRDFRTALKQVCTVYPDAKVEELIEGNMPRGLILKNSKPPVRKTSIVVKKPDL